MTLQYYNQDFRFINLILLCRVSINIHGIFIYIEFLELKSWDKFPVNMNEVLCIMCNHFGDPFPVTSDCCLKGSVYDILSDTSHMTFLNIFSHCRIYPPNDFFHIPTCTPPWCMMGHLVRSSCRNWLTPHLTTVLVSWTKLWWNITISQDECSTATESETTCNAVWLSIEVKPITRQTADNTSRHYIASIPFKQQDLADRYTMSR